MIADTLSPFTQRERLAPNAAGSATPARDGLTPVELYRLTLYKWRYALEAAGFSSDQVRQLMFVKWLNATNRLAS